MTCNTAIPDIFHMRVIRVTQSGTFRGAHVTKDTRIAPHPADAL